MYTPPISSCRMGRKPVYKPIVYGVPFLLVQWLQPNTLPDRSPNMSVAACPTRPHFSRGRKNKGGAGASLPSAHLGSWPCPRLPARIPGRRPGSHKVTSPPRARRVTPGTTTTPRAAIDQRLRERVRDPSSADDAARGGQSY